jgi:WhiB family transcriptional regulator, redox-sensing transcriptional regulator
VSRSDGVSTTARTCPRGEKPDPLPRGPHRTRHLADPDCAARGKVPPRTSGTNRMLGLRRSVVVLARLVVVAIRRSARTTTSRRAEVVSLNENRLRWDFVPYPRDGRGLTVGHMSREMSWQRQGACYGRADQANWWFPPVGDRAVPARAICARCKVRDACLQYAIDNNITDGVWGGLSPSERRQLRHTAG